MCMYSTSIEQLYRIHEFWNATGTDSTSYKLLLSWSKPTSSRLYNRNWYRNNSCGICLNVPSFTSSQSS